MAKYQILFTERAIEQLSNMDASISDRMRSTMQEKLSSEPFRFGKPLQNTLAGLRSLRIGDWRVIFTIDGKTIRVFAIFHRSKGYPS